jgi:hypothetical protein
MEKPASLKSAMPPGDAHRALEERVAASRQLEKSARLRTLFLYLCQQARAEGANDLKEQRVGCEFFGRAVDYDTALDNIVRVQVSMLRKKLREYFATDGAAEPWIVEIPPGGYLPVFRRATSPAPAEESGGMEPLGLPQVPIRAKPNRAMVWMATALAAVSCMAIWLAIDRQRLVAAKAPSGSVWAQLFANGRRTDIVLADSNLGLMEDLLQRPVSLGEYVNKSYMGWLDRYPPGSEQRRLLEVVSGRLHTSVADVLLLRSAFIESPTPQSIAIQYARGFDPQELRTDNVVLLGSKKSNPWIEAVEGKLGMRFEWPAGADHESLVSVRPQDRQPVYTATPFSGGVDISHTLVALVPNLSAQGIVLLIAGTNAQATAAGGELLVAPGVNQLRARLGVAKLQPLPYFEAVLRSTHVGGSEGAFEILSARAIR